MFDKRKMNFWRLFIIFSGLIFVTLYFLWSSPKPQNSTMMNESMGNMMKQKHLDKPITLNDLFSNENQKSQMGSMSSHHQEQPEIMRVINDITTLTVFILLPLILGGAVFLAIVWLK